MVRASDYDALAEQREEIARLNAQLKQRDEDISLYRAWKEQQNG
jgi:hypothetical protein